MDEIKMKVVSKELNGGTSTADVTFNSTNNMTAETSSTDPSIPGDDISSEGAEQGEILTADGSGGASWEPAQGGTQLYKHQLTIDLDGSNRSCIVYSLSESSLARTSPGGLISPNYVSGLVDYGDNDSYAPILAVTHTSECMLFYIDDYGNLQYGAFSWISADIVTAI